MRREHLIVIFAILSAGWPSAASAADDALIPTPAAPSAQTESTAQPDAEAMDNQPAETKKTPYDNALESGYAGSSDVCRDACFLPRVAVRFGWWGTSNNGSELKTGEFQDLSPSPFWDIDALLSDGMQTWDFSISEFDNEANDARLQFYGDYLKAKIHYDRYLRRWDHDPLRGTPFPPGTPYPPHDPGLPGDVGNVRTQDLNVGEDYAIRVEEFEAKFQGQLTDNIKWKLNLWGMKKFGERQVNATAHCFNTNVPAAAGATGNACHVLSERQVIDWTTMEIQPVIEARFGHVIVEYSRTMRSFGQDDLITDRTYTRFNFNLPAASGFEGPPYTYAFVPESFTAIDRLKVSAPIADCTQFYANLYYGDTHNEFRETHREFSGFDLRLTNHSFDNLTLTGYATMDDEDNQDPPFFFKKAPFSPPTTPPYDEVSNRHPVDRTRTRAGVKASWRPYECSCDEWGGLLLVGGYEYYLLERDHATFPITLSANPEVEGEFTQQDTKTHQIDFGPDMRWSRSLDTYVRYKGRFIEDPLIGVREHNGAFNTNQPEQEHGVDIGGTWTPTDCFLATAQFSIVNRWHESEFADFIEDDYPFVCTLWYSPRDRWSFTGGFAHYSNWIDQDITLGFTVPGVPSPPVRTETTRWDYEGQNNLISVGATYACTKCLRLLGGFEWDHGTNVFTVPKSPAGADWSRLRSISDVEVITQRATAGLDWQPYEHVSVYFRYIYYDWEDVSAGIDSGTSHMFLAGLSMVF